MGKGPAQTHLHSRISYLYQAATYLAEASGEEQTSPLSLDGEAVIVDSHKTGSTTSKDPTSAETVSKITQDESHNTLETESIGHKGSAFTGPLLGHLRAVSLKGQIRLSPAMKHSICKRCDLLLIPGKSATTQTENNSRGGRKAWAEVLVTTCRTCGTAKRFPVGARRRTRRQDRSTQANFKLEGSRS